jgi:two-component system, OmpR family, response regulator QseB
MRILVVEDDPILLDGLTTGLTLHGMTADGVGTCEDAMTAVATASFAAIVLDLMLPDGSGIDVLRHLRRRHDATPVLILTARDVVGGRWPGRDEGADDCLGKPFDLDELAARLRALGRRTTGARPA